MINESSAEYMDEVMQKCNGMAPEIFQEIEREVKSQLDNKVEEMLNDVVDADQTDQARFDDDAMNELVPKFRNCKDDPGPGFNDTVRDFCQSVVNSGPVRADIEELVTVLKNYAEDTTAADGQVA